MSVLDDLIISSRLSIHTISLRYLLLSIWLILGWPFLLSSYWPLYPAWGLFVFYKLLVDPIVFLRISPAKDQKEFEKLKQSPLMANALEETDQLFTQHFVPITSKIAIFFFSIFTLLFFYNWRLTFAPLFLGLGIETLLFLGLSVYKVLLPRS